MKRFLGIIALLLTGTSCLPLPHMEPQTPHVTGVVTTGGKPLVNVEVRLSYYPLKDMICATPQKTTVTDHEGRFEFKQIKSLRFVKVFIGDFGYEWCVCIFIDGKTYLGMEYGNIGFPPDSISLQCVIEPDSKDVNADIPQNEIHRYSVCKFSKFNN